MNSIYFYIYLTVIFTVTISFTILRCVFNIHDIDIFFYPNHANNIIENKVYLVSHIIVNFLLGLLFGFEIILGMFVKIMIFEAYLHIMEHCDIFYVSKISNLIIIVLISLVSYTFGSVVNKILYK
jgi:hypothetical protein